MTKKYQTLIIMPYLPLGGSFKFDSLLVWSYQKLAGSSIKDVSLKSHLDKLVASYQFHNGGAIPNPTIISTSKDLFSNPNRISISKVEVLKTVLLFAGIVENNQWSFVTSDNFETYYQRFNVGDEGISTQAGAIHRITTGGYKIGQVAFVKPEHVNIPLHFRPKGTVILALEDCMKNSSLDIEKSRVIQSLSPFFNSYRNSHEQSWHSRILLLIMAFELLFGETGRPQFRSNVEKYSNHDWSKYKPVTYNYPIYDHGKLKRHEPLTLNQIWAEEFYKLRHKIIHGDTVYSDDFIFKDLNGLLKPREPHFYIAVNFFVICLLNKLREIGFSKVPHYVIDPEKKLGSFYKNISGIKDETFGIGDLELFDVLSRK